MGDSALCYEAVLAERARALAARTDAVAAREVYVTAVVLAVGEERFGLDARLLSEVVPLGPIHWLPGLPPCVRGLALVRSEAVSVVDLGRWFSVSGTSEPKYLVVLEGAPGRLALLGDRVDDVRVIYRDELLPKEIGHGVDRQHPVDATTRDLLTLLDVRRLFESDRIRMQSARRSAEP